MKKKSILWIFFVVLSVNVATIALAQHNTMVKKIDYMNDELSIVGLNNFEPFSDYVEGNAYGSRVLRSAFLKPLLNTLQNHSVKWEPITFNIFDRINWFFRHEPVSSMCLSVLMPIPKNLTPCN